MAALSATAGTAWIPRRPRRVILAATVLAAGLIGTGAFVAGQHHRPSGVTMLAGLAYSGGQQASVTVDGWTYGLVRTSDLAWSDSAG